MIHTTDGCWVLLDNVAFVMCPDEALAKKLTAELNGAQDMTAERDALAKALTDAQASLRDRFAMAALTGIMACPDIKADDAQLGKYAYEMADFTLAARGGAS